MDRPTLAPATVTLDVTTDDALHLRRRLQARPEMHTTAVLPGGVLLEDGPEATTYHFPVAGAWAATGEGDDLRLAHPAGHVLTVRDGRVQITLAK